MEFLSIFFLDVFHVFLEGLLFVGFVDVDCVVDELLELLVEVVAILLVFIVFFVDGFDVVVVLLVVGSELGLLLEELFGAFELLLSFFLFLLNYDCEFA